jgi:hypothetical protein
MKMRTALIICVLLVAGAIGLREALAQHDSQSATCAITVPAEWGEFKGASSFGLVFQDSAGTLRFVRNVGCQIHDTQPVPLISLEVRRK